MPVLLIDTAFETCQVGLVRDMNIVAEKRTVGGGQHDKILASITEEILEQAKTHLKEIRKIVVTTGPGRFTGLRVGIAFARGLALVNKTPLVGVLTTDAIAKDMDRNHPDEGLKAVVVAVKRGESFIECKAHGTGIISVPDSEIVAYVKKWDDVLIGGVLSQAASEALLSKGVRIACDVTEPSLDAIASIGLPTLPQGAVRPYYAA